MDRLVRETRETFSTLAFVSCIIVGIVGLSFYILGPDGALFGPLHKIFQDPGRATLFAILGVIACLALVKRLLDKTGSTLLNNLLVLSVGIFGFVIIFRALLGILN